MSKFPFRLYSIPTIADGSCFLHAVLRAISPDYTEKNKEERIGMVRKIRFLLSEMLDDPDSLDGEKSYYDILSRGELKNLSEHMDETKIENMKRFLDSDSWFNHLYVEFVSLVFDIDIYIIDYSQGELYNLGDNELFYRGRNSVIIGYSNNNHFETLAIKDENGIKRTYFSPTSAPIRELNSLLFRNRLKDETKIQK